MSTIFYPAAKYVPVLPTEFSSTAVPLLDLCAQARVPCRASGAWINRRVSWSPSADWCLTAEPGPMGSVHVEFPIQEGRSPLTAARAVLLALAYGLFDGVARESVRGLEWSRNLTPRGRPRVACPLTSAQRQRDWRKRQEGVSVA